MLRDMSGRLQTNIISRRKIDTYAYVKKTKKISSRHLVRLCPDVLTCRTIRPEMINNIRASGSINKFFVITYT